MVPHAGAVVGVLAAAVGPVRRLDHLAYHLDCLARPAVAALDERSLKVVRLPSGH